MKITSTQFENNGLIPQKYTCDGGDTIPPFNFEEVPSDAKSLAIICQDPDSPSGDFVHWIIFNIKPKTSEIKEGEVPDGAIQGANDFGNSNYGGPCPGSGSHRYVFKLYALDKKFEIKSPDKTQFREAIKSHIIAETELIGNYQRK